MDEAIWLRFKGGQAEAIQRAIENKGEFTATVAKSEVKPKKFQVCLVSLQNDEAVDFSIDYVGISRSGSLVATDERRIKVSNLIDAGPIRVRTLVDRLDKRFANRVPEWFGDPIRLPPRLTEVLLEAIQRESHAICSGMPGIRSRIAEMGHIDLQPYGGLDVFERDAVITSLETFGGTDFRKNILRGTQPASQSTPSFLNRLSHYTIREDLQINFDAIVFPGFKINRSEIFGAVQVVNSTGQQLTIINCNRQPLEETLGVDLIYYSHSFRSFVLVQYKRLIAENGGTAVYRPDSDHNYAIELKKMNNAIEDLNRIPTTISSENDYRLGSEAFFFKFCEARQKSSLDAGMVSGMYVPLGVWNQFAQSDKARGPRGGFRVDWDHHPRSLNNSKFCQLLKDGWIGSKVEQTKRLDEVIERTLAGRQMLVLASTTPGKHQTEQLRDDFGRFTFASDPLGER